ncbi:MAG: hypothetical protein O3B65_06470, partial [Chloroflexi bacterium]|nr:hypothetical protein [Chloroflexota bacterium]
LAFPYLAVYLAGIVLPLMLLFGNFTLFGARSSVCLGVASLLALPLYIGVIYKRLGIEWMIGEFKDRSLREMQDGRTSEPDSNSLSILNDIATGAFQSRDFGSFRAATSAVGNVAVRLRDRRRPQGGPLAVSEAIDALRELGRRVAADRVSVIHVMEVIGVVGRAQGMESSTRARAMGALQEIGKETIKAESAPASELAIHLVRSIVGSAMDAGVWEESEFHLALSVLRELGIDSARHRLGTP